MDFQSFNDFYHYMNQHRRNSWCLVGGAAAFEHILSKTDDIGLLAAIFPQDLDLLMTGTPFDEAMTVTCSSTVLEVDFVAPESHVAEALVASADTVNVCVRVLQIEDIINRYTIATSKKSDVRQLRVAALQMIKRKQKPTLAGAKEEKTTANPFGGDMFRKAAAGLKKTGNKVESDL